jgi:hypothetical protein
MHWNRLSGQGCLGYHLLIADYVASVVNSNSDIRSTSAVLHITSMGAPEAKIAY